MSHCAITLSLSLSLSLKFPNLILNFHLEKRKTETFEANKVLFENSLMTYDDAVKFISEMHDPCAQTVTYKREENTNTLPKASVWSRPNTLRRLSQKSSYNSRVLERGQLCVP